MFSFFSTARLPKYPWILKQMLLTLEVLASFALQLFCKFRVGLGVFWYLYKKSCWRVIRTRQRVEVVHAIWAARDTFDIQKYPTVISGEASS